MVQFFKIYPDTLELGQPSVAQICSENPPRSIGQRAVAPRVLKKVHKPGKMKADPLHGFFSLAPSDGERAGARGNQEAIVEYEPDSELRDFEQIPLLEEGGIEAFIRREVLPYTPDAWLVEADTKIGYEVSFTRHFYQPPQLRTLGQISADILALEQETEGLLHEITKGATA